MACVDLQLIDGDECIGASLPKINGNFAALSAAVCDLSANSTFNVVDSPTVDLTFDSYTRTLSADVKDASVTNAKIAFDGGAFAFRNKIINGDMKISQRYGTTVKVVSSVDGFGVPVDRFCFTDSIGANWPTNGIIRYKQNTINDLPGFTNSIFLSTSTVGTIGSTNCCGIRQSIEGINISDLAWGTSSAQPITVSFWVKSSLAGVHSLAINGLINDRTTIRRYVASYNITSANTWERETITIPGDTTAPTTWFMGTSAAGLNLIWSLGAGTNFQTTSGSWGTGGEVAATGTVNIIANAGATFEITGVQLEKGPTATPFEHRPIGTELALCQRYYEKSYNINVAPGTVSYSGMRVVRTYNISLQTSNGGFESIHFSNKKRSAPAIIIYSPQTGTKNRFYDWTFVDRTAMAYNIGDGGFETGYVGPAVAISAPTYHWTADAEL